MKQLIRAMAAVLVTVSVASGQEEAKQEKTIEQITGRCHCGHIRYEAQGPIL